MKSIVFVALALVAVAVAAPVDEPVNIVRADFNQNPEGSYNFGLETSDGTRRDETGEVKEVLNEENKPQNVVVVRGSFGYIDPEGNVQKVDYYADETGFHAEGPSIPKPARR